MQRREVGVQLIVAYKGAKAVIQLVLGVVLLVLAARLTHGLGHYVREIREHATAAWSLALADELGRLVTRRHIVIVALAAIIDAFVSAFEGWALHRRFWWSEWLVVGATSSLLPFEVVALAHHVSVVRVAAFVVNVAIVAYLAHRISRRRVPAGRGGAARRPRPLPLSLTPPRGGAAATSPSRRSW